MATLSTSASVNPLAESKINPNLIKAKYAVRGAILTRALELKQILKEKPGSLPFDEVIHCNIGNPQAVGQSPVTFYRDVLAAVLNPAILDSDEYHGVYDVGARVKKILRDTGSGSIGAYTHSQGLRVVRETVAQFIKERDGFPSDPDRIFLTNGASAGVDMMMKAMVFKPTHGVMIPVPQYPLYTALMSLLGGVTVPYYLDESTNWGIDFKDLKENYDQAIASGTEVRGIVIINPGNPTGQCLSSKDIENVIRFAAERNLVVMADEVYQVNVYDPNLEFTSFKKVLRTLETSGSLQEGKVPLISFHSTSKGLIGECGLRGGYFELVNVPDGTYQQLYKMASISLCSNTMGQVAVELMVNPPKEGEASYELFKKESETLYNNLKRKARMIQEALSNTPYMSVTALTGAMYAFPTIELPLGAIEAAKKKGVAPDALYCSELLEATGIVTVPGSGFRQRENSYHFRMTFLPPEKKIEGIATAISKFHRAFWSKYDGKKDL